MTTYQELKLAQGMQEIEHEARVFYKDFIDDYMSLLDKRLKEAVAHNFSNKATMEIVSEIRHFNKFVDLLDQATAVKNEELAKKVVALKKHLGLK